MKGFASVFSLMPTFDPPETGSCWEDDWRNIGSDFKRIGKDLENSIEKNMTDEKDKS